MVVFKPYTYNGFFPDEQERLDLIASISEITSKSTTVTTLQSKWKDIERYINQEVDPDLKKEAELKGRNIHILPWVASAYNQLAPSIINIIMGVENYWNVDSISQDFSRKIIAEANEKVIKRKQEQSYFDKEFAKAVDQLLLNGTTAMYVYYDEDISYRRGVHGTDKVEIDKDGFAIPVFESYEDQVVMYQGFKTLAIDLENLTIYPEVGDVSKSVRIYSYIDDLENIKNKGREGIYKKSEVDRLAEEFEISNSTGLVDTTRDLMGNSAVSYAQHSAVTRAIKCQYCFYPVLMMNNKIYERVCIVIAEDKYVLKFQAYPYTIDPIIVASLFQSKIAPNGLHSIYGNGAFDNMLVSTAIASSLSSLNLDLTSYSLPIVYGNLPDDFTLEPGAEINTDPDQIEIVQNNFNNPAIFQSIGMLKADMDQTAGLSSIAYPNSDNVQDPNIKATALAIGKKDIDMRLKSMAVNITKYLLIPVIRLQFEIMSATYDADDVASVLFDEIELQELKQGLLQPQQQQQSQSGTDDKKIILSQILSGKFFLDKYDIKVTGVETTFSKEEQIQNFSIFMQLAAQSSLFEHFDQGRLAEHLATITGLPEGVVLSETKVQEKAQAMQQQQQEQLRMQQQLTLEQQKSIIDGQLQLERLKGEIEESMTRLKNQAALDENTQDNVTALLKGKMQKSAKELDVSLRQGGAGL